MKYKNKIKLFFASFFILFSSISVFYVSGLSQNINLIDNASDRNIEDIANQILKIPATRGILPLDLEINGYVPYADIYDYPEFSYKLNSLFERNHNSFVSNHSVAALEFNFDVDIIIYDVFISVVQNKSALSSSETYSTSATVFNFKNMEIIDLNYFGYNTVSIINNQIKSIIAANPLEFVSNFSGISYNSTFYIDYSNIIIPFQTSSLSTIDRNIFNINISKENIQNEIISNRNFIILPPSQYNTVIVNLNYALPLFGYELREILQGRQFAIFKNDTRISNLIVGLNRYSLIVNSTSSIELEIHPLLNSNSLFAPLSFFREILGISAYMPNNNTIILSRYSEAN